MTLNPSIAPVCIAIAVALAACGGTPATPTAPVPSPTVPTPSPTATPDASIPPASSGCGKPYPPPLAGIASKIHIRAPEYFTLDSTPLVGPNSEYCREIGYTDGREYCPVRNTHDAEREACEAWLIGIAEDTGKPGPTWSRNYEYWCTTFEASGCQHNPDNPFSLFVTLGGKYQVCRGEDICGEVVVDR